MTASESRSGVNSNSFSSKIALGQLAQVSYFLITLHFVRDQGSLITGAVGTSLGLSGIFFSVGAGLVAAQDSFVAWSFGAGQAERGRYWFIQSLWLTLGASFALSAGLRGLSWALPHFLKQPGVAGATGRLLGWIALSLPLQLFFQSCRQYLQSLGRPGAPTLILWLGNALQAALAASFWTGPDLAGVGRSILLSRLFMALAVGLVLAVRTRGNWPPRPVFLPERRPLAELFSLGAPSAGQAILEGGTFFVLFGLAGRLAAPLLGAHSVFVNLVNFTFAVPLGLSVAATNRVGRAWGAKSVGESYRLGWRMIGAAALVMTGFSALWLVMGARVVKGFVSHDDGLDLRTLIGLAAAFQLADGLQVVITGILRGLGDTRSPLVANVIGHWVIGLPLAALLCFGWGTRPGLGLVGLWTGLVVGFWCVSLWLFWIWVKRAGADGEVIDVRTYFSSGRFCRGRVWGQSGGGGVVEASEGRRVDAVRGGRDGALGDRLRERDGPGGNLRDTVVHADR